MKRNSANVAAARALVASGGSVADVARKFGLAWTTARQWVDPDYYAEHVRRSAAWRRGNRGRVNAAARARRPEMSDKQKEQRAATERARYHAKGAERFKRLRALAGDDERAALAWSVRLMVLGWSNRTAETHGALMQAITGMTRQEFTECFEGDGMLSYRVPLAAFDLTNPEHLVRANHPSNLRLGKGRAWKGRDVMKLQWCGEPDAIVRAQSFIGRELARSIGSLHQR